MERTRDIYTHGIMHGSWIMDHGSIQVRFILTSTYTERILSINYYYNLYNLTFIQNV